MSLPASGSYQRYTDIGRKFVLWSLVAADEFSVTPELFCFPIVGCMSYLGFFEEESAHDEAERLRVNGFEVVVGPVAAYSTLGWFSDPVLSSVLDFPDAELAGLIFHGWPMSVCLLKMIRRLMNHSQVLSSVRGW
ncbi:aminopeptidase [Arenicellales bacterium nBUS_45]